MKAARCAHWMPEPGRSDDSACKSWVVLPCRERHWTCPGSTRADRAAAPWPKKFPQPAARPGVLLAPQWENYLIPIRTNLMIYQVLIALGLLSCPVLIVAYLRRSFLPI